MEKQITAVSWLYDYLFPKQLDGFSDEEWGKIDKAFEQAKEMEKQQIIDAYKGSGSKHPAIQKIFDSQAEQYYNETFKQ